MRIYARDRTSFKFAEQTVYPVRGTAQAVHARIYLYVHVETACEPRRAYVGDGGGQIICRHAQGVLPVLRRSEHEYGQRYARGAELDALIGYGDAEHICHTAQSAGDGYGTVAVGIRLDDGKERSAARPRPEQRGVVRYRTDIYFCKRSLHTAILCGGREFCHSIYIILPHGGRVCNSFFAGRSIKYAHAAN